MDDDVLRKELLTAFEYSYIHDSWVHPLEETLEGISVEEAIWRPSPDAKGIWDIVLHLAVWHENIVERVMTGKTAHAPEAWPALPANPDEKAWENAKQQLRESLDSVRAMIETTPIEKIQSAPYGLGDLLCRFTHNGYHIGQIVKLRECMKA